MCERVRTRPFVLPPSSFRFCSTCLICAVACVHTPPCKLLYIRTVYYLTGGCVSTYHLKVPLVVSLLGDDRGQFLLEVTYLKNSQPITR